MRDPTVPIPDLDEGTPFQVDKFGFVTGFDDTLEIDLDLLIPNYNPNKHLEVVCFTVRLELIITRFFRSLMRIWRVMKIMREKEEKE